MWYYEYITNYKEIEIKYNQFSHKKLICIQREEVSLEHYAEMFQSEPWCFDEF